MTISNIWTTQEYKEKIEALLEDKNVFERNTFFETHQYRDIDEKTEENTNDHDISVYDEMTFDVFVEHLSCYFTR
jgi:hypothetical protein